jgi:hypothetical protein
MWWLSKHVSYPQSFKFFSKGKIKKNSKKKKNICHKISPFFEDLAIS